MPIETDLSVSPYFDEAAAGIEKNYYKILFKPSVPVQVRELNELQTILQNQIEEFGDNILKKGTIIRGCSFSFYNNYPYIKIRDLQEDGAPVNISAYNGKMLSSANNLKAVVLDYAEGFEATDPDTKTLYLRYTNSGDNANVSTFVAGEVLKVQDPSYSISNVVINVAGTGYANSDSIVFVSAIAVTDVTGTIANGTQLTQANTGANAVVVSVDSTSFPNKTILVLRPVTGDLTDTTKSANSWTFVVGDDILKSSSNAAVTAVITETIGSGAAAVLTTDGSQRITDVSMINGGTGYYVAPYVTARSSGGGTGTSLTAQNYSSRITVYSGANSVGTGYAFGVSDGIVYQKGYFLNVPAQSIVVSKYNTFPNNVSVGFFTSEEIIDAYEDTELLDNSIGTRNYTAPGADRLQLEPVLEVVATDQARSNLEFFAIVEFSDGVPYKQNQKTVYSGITDEMAIRTVDSTGDFVTDQFLVACKSTPNTSLRGNTFSVVVDPGTAYIDGYRVKTYGNYTFSMDKGIDTEVKQTANVSLNYGSYVVVDNLAGSFDFSAVGTVELYSNASLYLANSSQYSTGTITAPGGLIGTAKVRSIIYADSSSTSYPQGSPSSKYNMYLFDIQMNAGKSFKDVQSIFYDGATYKGIADVVLENITTAGSTTTTLGAVLKNTVGTDKKSLDKLVFYSGFDSPLSINTVSYQYRTFDDSGTTYTLGNTGTIVITLSGNEYFPYNTDLTAAQRQQLVFMPLTSVYANAAAGGAGNTVINSSNSTISSGNSSFTTSLRIGDYVKLSGNSSENVIRRVVSITNATHLTIDAAPGFTNSTGSTTRAFPAYIPLPILTRDGVTATANTDSRTLTVDIGTRLAGASNTIPLAAAFNISVSNASITSKTPNRNLYVKIFPANNTTGFGYIQYGTGVNGVFTSGSNAVANTTTSSFIAGQQLKVVQSGSDFLATVGTITNSTHMTLANTVNFTGNADIYAAVNSEGPWCLGVPDIFRLKNVYLANTVNVNTNSADVTRDFYIDHNHNSNFADLGFLVKNKASSLVIGPTDYLLVKFDAFTRNEEDRVVHINSYVSANAATRANVDSLPLANLNNSVTNTLEIPEIFSATGSYYDMINHIDFRPKVANTANLSTTAAGATVNPAYTVTFSAANKKFPVPDSTMSFNAEYFMGRIDTVYVAADGKIGTAKGHPYPSTILNTRDPDELLTPVPKSGTMVLNYIKVPAYPSIEENAAASVYDVLNKRVINESVLNRRRNEKAISRLLTAQNIALEQPRQYSMDDIGNLERRIRDLEYYVSLSVLELSIKDLNLPSSISPNINRFKYGFFVDSFDDLTYTDVDSVEYAAAIENKRVVPPYETFKVIIPAPPCEYADYSMVSQLKATGEKAAPPPVCVKANAALDSSTRRGSLQEFYITMASDLANTSGRVVVYAYYYGGSLNNGALRVFQSKTANGFAATTDWRQAIFTAAQSTGLSSEDVSYLRSIPGSSFASGNSFRKHGRKHGKDGPKGNGETYLVRGGKIIFNHNPANGIYYKIVTGEAGDLRVEYPINVPCTNVGEYIAQGGAASYFGTLKILTSSTASTSFALDSNNKVKDNLTVEYYRLRLTANGLKPATLHKVYFNKTDLTHLCDTSPRDSQLPRPPVFSSNSNATWEQYSTQIPDFFNDAPNGYIMTDASGSLDMYLYILKDETRVTTTTTKKKKKKTTSTTSEYDEVTNPVIEIYNTDKSSYSYAVTEKIYKLFSGFKV
jgi:hypothetical protein